MAGLGIAFISAHTVASELADGRLAVLDVAGLPVWRHWSVISRADKILLPPAQEAFDFIAREGARFLPDPPSAGDSRCRRRPSCYDGTGQA